jgi:hypothetical protein
MMDKALVGVAGEYYIAFRLSSMGHHVGFTAPGARAADLLVSNLETGKSITIQAKTMQQAFVKSKKYDPYWKWRVGTSRVHPHETFYYLFVDLRDGLSDAPDVFIVPSLSLEPLLNRFPSSGPPFTDVWCTISDKDKGAYRDRWDLLRVHSHKTGVPCACKDMSRETGFWGRPSTFRAKRTF